jgi:hypothetical protein
MMPPAIAAEIAVSCAWPKLIVSGSSAEFVRHVELRPWNGDHARRSRRAAIVDLIGCFAGTATALTSRLL